MHDLILTEISDVFKKYAKNRITAERAVDQIRGIINGDAGRPSGGHMDRATIIHDLEALRDAFNDEYQACPLCLDEAITIIKGGETNG